MIRRHVPLALALLPLLALPSAAQIPIGGRVLDDRGAPLAGAEVALVRFPDWAERLRLELDGRADLEPAATAKSGADGRFRLAAPEPGMWKVRVTARGFVPREHPLYPLFETAELPDVKLPRDAGFAVRVLDPAGRPLAGARVSIGERKGRAPSADPWRTAWRRAVADDQGRAALPRTDEEELRLWAVAPGHLAAELDAEGPPLDVRLGAGCPRTVEVREPGGGPAAGAFVEAATWVLGTTDEAGRLAITAPCGSATEVAVTMADGRRATADLKPASQGAKQAEPPPLAVTLPKQPARLAGRVLEQGTRAPIGDAFVWPGEPGDAVRTDAEGRYALVVTPGAPGERSWLSAETGRHLRATEQAPPAPAAGGEAAGATFALAPAAVIAGAVVDESDRPVAGVELRATAAAQRFPFPRPRSGGFFTRSDVAGRFRLWLPAGTAHDLAATHPDYTAGRLAVPGLAPHEARTDLEVVLARGVDAFGHVVDGADRPVAGATVRLVALPAAAASGPDAFFARLVSDEQTPEATTGAEGRFGFAHLAPGRFDLTVRAAGFGPVTVRGVEVREGGAAADLGTVVLGPGATVEGRVVDRRGTPIPGAAVFFQTAAGPRLSRSQRLVEGTEPQATTDADGRFTLVDLAPGGRIALTIVKPGYAEGSLPGVEVPPASPVEIVLAAAARLSGRVLDADREPIAEARVLLFKERSGMMLGDTVLPGRMAGSATTDAEGRFTLADLEPGTVTLEVQARGFVSAERAGLQVREGEDRTGIEVVLERGATIAGRVLGADGTPAAGARVTVLEKSNAVAFRPGQSRATADGDGAYRLEGVAPGPRSVVAEHDDWLRAARDLEVVRGENRLDLRLGRGVEVAGSVVDAADRPVAEATVDLVGSGGLFSRSEATSDAAGRFLFEGVAPGAYRLSARKAGYAAAALPDELRVEAAPVAGLELRLDRGGAIRGRVTGVAPEEVPQIEVSAFTGARGGGFFESNRAEGRVDHQGEYRIEPVAAGEWEVFGRLRESGRSARGRVTVATGGEAVLDLDLGGGGLVLTGRVTRGGEPVAGVLVSVSGRDVGAGGSATTSSEGAFRVEGLSAGSYDVSLMEFQSGLHHVEQVALDGDREVSIEVPTHRVSGVVVDADHGSPVAGAVVAVEPVAPAGPRRFMARGTRSGDDGLFTVTDVEEGELRVRATKDGYEPGEATVRVGTGDATDVRLALRPSAGLVLEVRGPSGLPPAEVQVALLDATSRAVLQGRYVTGEGGRVRLASAPAGSFRLLAADDLASATLEVTVPGPPLGVVLAPTSELVVIVPALAESRLPATLTIAGADGRPFQSLGFGSLWSEWPSIDGRFSVRQVPAGTWRLTVTAGDGRVFQGTATTGNAGGRVEVALE